MKTTLSGDAVETELVNVAEHGREGVTMIDRSTRFGNPFKMREDGREYSREECIDAYREWFRDRLEDDELAADGEIDRQMSANGETQVALAGDY